MNFSIIERDRGMLFNTKFEETLLFIGNEHGKPIVHSPFDLKSNGDWLEVTAFEIRQRSSIECRLFYHGINIINTKPNYFTPDNFKEAIEQLEPELTVAQIKKIKSILKYQ